MTMEGTRESQEMAVLTPRKHEFALGKLGSIKTIRNAKVGRYPLLEITNPVLANVREGQMQVTLAEGRTILANAGQTMAICGGTVIDVTYMPGNNGHYLADLLTLSEDILEGNPAAAKDSPTCHLVPATDQLEECFGRCARALAPESAIPASIANHRLKELLLWLRTQNIHLGSAPRGIAHKLRKIFDEDTATEWPIPRILQRLATEGHAMSAATLRRRLAEAGTNVCEIITEVRLMRALCLLQTTDLTISRIAWDCGYSSPSRFAQRFRERFGQAPSTLRGGTETDQV